MIKINLLAERKAAKAKAPGGGLKLEGLSGGSNLLLLGVLVVGLLVAGGWYLMTSNELKEHQERKREAEAEVARLVEIRKKADEFKRQKELLERKINLITELKKKQSVPVHILDQVSRNLPDFLWLDTMTAASNQVAIAGKATTYNAVSNFYDNLIASGQFQNVVLGRTSEIAEGVTFSLTCTYQPPAEAAAASAPAPEAPAPSPAPATKG